jgi:polysaccharide export outer membrane protein
VTQYYSRSVYVQGAVTKPGRYGFERIPGLIEIIGQAGGALPTAELSRVEIVRKDDKGGRRTMYANVAAAQRDGNPATLPQIQAGDIITIPGGMGTGLGVSGDGVGVLGEVTRPGVYPVGAGQDLWTVLAVAGGLTAHGNLRKVKIITHEGQTHAVTTLDLKQMLDQGSHRPQIVRPGDVVYVMPSGSTKFGQAFSGIQALLSVSTDVLNLVVLQKLINDEPIR